MMPQGPEQGEERWGVNAGVAPRVTASHLTFQVWVTHVGQSSFLS